MQRKELHHSDAVPFFARLRSLDYLRTREKPPGTVLDAPSRKASAAFLKGDKKRVDDSGGDPWQVDPRSRDGLAG